MVEVLLEPKGYEWWFDDSLELVRAVYDELLDRAPLYIVSFTPAQMPMARDILKEKCPGISMEELGEILRGEVSAYIHPYGFLVVPISRPIISEHTMAFFHEATHHVAHTTDLLQRLALAHALIVPQIWLALSTTRSLQLAISHYNYVDELFAHYVSLCYVVRLSRERCDPGKWFEKAGSLVESREGLLETYRIITGQRDLDPQVLESVETIFTTRMHETFTQIIKKHPADFYNEYISKPRERSIFEGREELLKWYGDP